MSTRTREQSPATLRRTPQRTRRTWWMVGLAALVAAGAAIALWQIGGSPATSPVPRANGSGIVTGTGPDLVRVAEQSAADRLVTGTGPDLATLADRYLAGQSNGRVTGTGPGLTFVARQSEAHAIRMISGTGPDLARVAGDPPPAITGTGPDLSRVANQ